MAELVFGNVPYPSVVQSHLPASNPYVVEGGAPDIPDAMFWHRMVGSLIGTDGWFHGGNAATAYGVGVAATDGAGLAGTIYEWIAPRTGWYGESSGPAKNPYGDGAKFVAEVGVYNVNRRSKAIEISGEYNTPLDPKSRDSIINMTAYWADQKRIPWNEFPILPNGRSFVIWHNEITGLAYKQCPGSVVIDETNDLIEGVRKVLKAAQGVGGVVVVPPPTIRPRAITWEPGDVGIEDYHGTPVLKMRVQVVATKGTQPRLTASKNSPGYGDEIPPMGEVIIVGTTDSNWGFAEMPDGTFPRISLGRVRPALPRPKHVPS